MAKRGDIYSHDNSPLVINQPSYLVYAEPQLITDKKNTGKILSEYLKIEEASIAAKIETTSSKWISLKDNLNSDLMIALKQKKLSGIGFLEENSRYYPEGSMSSHLLGFVGKNHNGSPQGYFGLEGYYNEQLKGKPGFIKEEKDAIGNPILSGDRQIIPPIDGYNLHLSLDKTVQYLVESKLSQALNKYGAKAGTVTVMDPFTGEIKAIASLPSYDLSRRLEYDQSIYKNPVINSSYEPGSTFKILVMAAALNEGKILANDTFNETGSINIGKYNIKTWDNKYHGQIKMAEILQYSSNVGMVFIQEKLGSGKLIEYFKNLGVGSLIGVDLEDESTPDMRPENKWYQIDYATASFGQGIAVTPMQMIRMASSIANGGKLITPHLVTKITNSHGKIINFPSYPQKNIFKKETSSIVTEMMTQAVEKGETKFLKPMGIRVAGKTGTAQIPIAGHYDTQKTIASFVGFFPSEKPKIIMLVTLQEPTSSPWGSETAAPLFFSIAKDLIAYYNIPLNY